MGAGPFRRGLHLAFLLSAVVFAAAASAGGFSSPGSGERVGAGRQVELRWEGLPGGIEEMELLVSLDGGRGFARVADLAPSQTSYIWLVPSLPAERAMLAIRGRVQDHETLLLETGTFAIERAGEPLQLLSYHGDELWTDGSGSLTPTTDSGVTDRHRTALGSLAADESVEDSSSMERASAPVFSRASSAPAGLSWPNVEPSLSRIPLAFPQRN